MCVLVCVDYMYVPSANSVTVTVTPPQLDLKSGKTSTLLDVVNRPNTGRLHTKIAGGVACVREKKKSNITGENFSPFSSPSGEFAGIYEALPSCCWSADSQRVVFSSACRNWKVTTRYYKE